MRRAARAAALLLALLAAPTRPDGGAEEPRLELTLQNGHVRVVRAADLGAYELFNDGVAAQQR